MIVRCGWCGKRLGEKPPLDDPNESTDICKPCAKAFYAELGIEDRPFAGQPSVDPLDPER